MTDDIKTILVQLELARSQRDRALASMDEAITQLKKIEALRDQLDVELVAVRAENERLENITASSVHTCHDQCARPMCVLRRELQRVKAELEDYVQHKKQLDAELAALRRDKARLDWLDSKSCYSWQFDIDCEKLTTKYKHRPLQIRDAIDAAMNGGAS